MRVFQNRSYCTSYEPQPGCFFFEVTRVIERALDAGYEPVSFLAGNGAERRKRSATAHCCPDASGSIQRDEGAGDSSQALPSRAASLRDAPPHASGYGGNLPECPPRGDSGKCREPDECRCDFSVPPPRWHRCRAPHIRLQQLTRFTAAPSA